MRSVNIEIVYNFPLFIKLILDSSYNVFEIK